MVLFMANQLVEHGIVEGLYTRQQIFQSEVRQAIITNIL